MTNRSVASVDRPPLAVAYSVAYPVVYVLYAPGLFRPAQSVDPHSKDLENFLSPSRWRPAQSVDPHSKDFENIQSPSRLCPAQCVDPHSKDLVNFQSPVLLRPSASSCQFCCLSSSLCSLLYAPVSRGWRQSCSFCRQTVFTIE